MRLIISATLIATAAGAAALAQVPAPQPTLNVAKLQPANCAKLVGQRFGAATIEQAIVHPAGERVGGAATLNFIGMTPDQSPVQGLPEFCRVSGVIRPTSVSNIRFEVWLPTRGWDGRFAGTYNGGLAGYLNYMDLASALRAGHAAASVDTGHVMADSSAVWARGHPERVRDYAWRSIHEMTVTGKAVTAAFYGSRPKQSYFIGCSNGGRQALIEAGRFPEDYDGIIAGAPAARITHSIMSMVNATQAQLSPGAALRAVHAALLQEETLAQCDASDGQKDGLVEDPRLCRFDVSKLACGTSKSPLCLAPPQIGALQRIRAGAFAGNRRIVHGFPLTGAEVSFPSAGTGWDGSILGRFEQVPGSKSLAASFLEDLSPVQIATVETFDFARDPRRLEQLLGAELDAKPDLSGFFARGGKLIMYHGWSDPLLPAEATLDFYADILRASGPRAAAQSRLFMAPGMQHCAAGPGPNSFGQSGWAQPSDIPERNIGMALRHWVEHGRVPKRVISGWGGGIMGGSKVAGPKREWLLCAWPRRAVLRAGMDPDVASSYVCSARRRH